VQLQDAAGKRQQERAMRGETEMAVIEALVLTFEEILGVAS
jgi:hypothetical protein